MANDGAVGWCCLGSFDSDPVLYGILDSKRGGEFSIKPVEPYETTRAYLPGSAILETIFVTQSGRVAVLDFMPVGRKKGAGLHDYVSLEAPGVLCRLVIGRQGQVEMNLRFFPSRPFDGCDTPSSHLRLLADIPIETKGSSVIENRISLSPNESHFFAVTSRTGPGRTLDKEALHRWLNITKAFWAEWASYCRAGGPNKDMVLRSAITLKLLTYAPTGAIVAAPTTSLPEKIGGTRNWDYRYCWLRDTAFALYALATLGYSGEARRFAAFVRNACKKTHPKVQIMYGLRGESDLPERTLKHLDGYRHSSPVRTGNAAYKQQQLDVYGEVLDWAFGYRQLGGRLDVDGERFLASMADFVADHWEEPEQGIWEMRGPPKHHVLGKAMSWVALDRVIKMNLASKRHVVIRDKIFDTILARGVDFKGGHLVQAFDETRLDASLLLIPSLGIPLPEKLLDATVRATERELRAGDFVYRYFGDDGLPKGDGAFLVCSFWLVDAMLATQRTDEAQELFERLLGKANDLGLYSEEIDSGTGDFLGNFPQALTHLGLIQSAMNIGLFHSRGIEAIKTSNAGRARLGVGAVAGIRGLWAAFRQSGKVGRVRSSRESMVPAG